jgi:hypothetical protein
MPLEFPDPVVARYLERIAELPVADRKLLDFSVRDYGARVPIHLLPFFWLHNVQIRLRCFVFIRRSVMACTDRPARQRYQQFYRELFLAEWPAGAVGRVAVGLMAVRGREHGTSRVFEVAVGRVLSRATIGWRDDAISEPIVSHPAAPTA